MLVDVKPEISERRRSCALLFVSMNLSLRGQSRYIAVSAAHFNPPGGRAEAAWPVRGASRRTAATRQRQIAALKSATETGRDAGRYRLASASRRLD